METQNSRSADCLISDLQKSVECLSSTILELSQKKKECMWKLHPTSEVPSATLLSRIQYEMIYKAAVHENKRHLIYLMSAQRLVGVTVEVIGKGKMKIRYETCYKGEYFEPFYLVVKFIKKQAKICWHTLPDFIPHMSVVEKYNNHDSDFLMMVHSIHKYVSAFVRRRQQAIEFSTKYKEYLREDIAAFEAYSTVQLVLEIPVNTRDHFLLVLQLHYRDLQSTLPSNVKCSDTANLPVDRSRIKQTFMTLPIAGAFQNLFLDQNIEHG